MNSAQRTLKFGWPRRGLSGFFNTFRLGRSCASWSPGDTVDLVCARTGKLLNRATVVTVHVGPLTQLAALHARDAHNWREHPFQDRPRLLVESLSKRYPPGRVKSDSIVSVVYLKEDDARRNCGPAQALQEAARLDGVQDPSTTPRGG